MKGMEKRHCRFCKTWLPEGTTGSELDWHNCGLCQNDVSAAAVRENGRKGGRPKGRPSPRDFGEGFITTPKGYYCQDCGRWVSWKRESRYSTGAEVRQVCVSCFDQAREALLHTLFEANLNE